MLSLFSASCCRQPLTDTGIAMPHQQHCCCHLPAAVDKWALCLQILVILSSTSSRSGQSFQDSLTMKISNISSVIIVLLCLCSQHTTNAQFGGFRDIFRPLQNFLKPVMRFFGGGPKFVDDGTQAPQATGRDKLFPDDCGRDEDKGTGKLCFPDGKLCEESKFNSQNVTSSRYCSLKYYTHGYFCFCVYYLEMNVMTQMNIRKMFETPLL